LPAFASDKFLAKVSENGCARLRMCAVKCLFGLMVAFGFAAKIGKNPLENPRVDGSIPPLATKFERLS
jgi:hypothetical protein